MNHLHRDDEEEVQDEWVDTAVKFGALSWLAIIVMAARGLRVDGQCNSRYYAEDSFVCVCDAHACDEVGEVVPPAAGTYVLYTSTRDRDRLAHSVGDIGSEADPGASVVVIDSSRPKNQILGFGGAFTDSAGINIAALSEAAQENLLRAYFAPEGIGYNLCRVPIAGSDCSTRPYSYDDVEGDVALEKWALTPEDYDYKLPFIKRAAQLNSEEMFYFGSPWSPPSWMKTNGMFNGSGSLLPEFWQPWAQYLVKFVEAYEGEGVLMWGLTTQNEPEIGQFSEWSYNQLTWTAQNMTDWIKTNLGPTLEAADMRRLKMMVADSTRYSLPRFVAPIIADPESNEYVDGVAVHWYADKVIGPEVIVATSELDPRKFILYTEASEGWNKFDQSVRLGSWTRGENYYQDIIENLNYLSSGWVDWNLALNLEGGPNWADNFLDAAVIVNETSDEFYKQPMFYAMGHASRFLRRYGIVQETTVQGEELRAASATNPDGNIVLLLLNKADSVIPVSVQVNHGRFINAELPAKSFQTFIIAGQ